MGRYSKSEDLLKRARQTIPLGAQTFSKSITQYPFGVSPYFIQRGEGSRVWDADGNEYIDFINSLNAITLGYNDFDVQKAVKLQLEEGTIFSLSHPLEMEVAELIVELVPCAEKVRFGKNGSDATAGAIRLARAFTGRDHVLVCGYHGWQDWYIGSTSRNKGVPKAVQGLTHTFQYNNIDSLHHLFNRFQDQVAAIIIEPMNIIEPEGNFLNEVKELTHKHGALLIFDETITGFRFANGGAQQYFGVTPDLATFGKGIANGYPLSAIAGRSDLMRFMEEIFFSFTFGGETLSLAASKATLQKLKREPVVETLYRQGKQIIEKLNPIIEKYQLKEQLTIAGHPSWSFLLFSDTEKYSQYEIKTLFLQEMFARGILMIGSHNMSYAHSNSDIDRLLSVYDKIFQIFREVLTNDTLHERLQCDPLEPLFKVR